MSTNEVSIITVCQNRLHHLKQSLPLMLQQSNAEVVVVDYACPQQSGDWVEQNFPEVRVVRVNDGSAFQLARARNKGVKSASGEWLFFVDADVRLEADVIRYVQQLAERRRDCFFIDGSRRPSLRGTLLMPKALFNTIGGYDEAIMVWGGEDNEFMDRLQEHGANWMFLPESFFAPIDHDDNERALGQIDGQPLTRPFLVQVSVSYRKIVRDMRLMGSPLSFTKRQQLMALLQKNFYQFYQTGDEQFLQIQVDLDIPERGLYQQNFRFVSRAMTYRFDLKQRHW